MVKKQTIPKAVEDCHQLLLWIIPKLDHFPRNRRYTLGERIENGLLEILENLTEAAYSRNKLALLQNANRHIAVIRHLWRLCFELKAVNKKSYQYGSQLLVELGQQIGGWQKASQ
jgi:hypothetical protein